MVTRQSNALHRKKQPQGRGAKLSARSSKGLLLSNHGCEFGKKEKPSFWLESPTLKKKAEYSAQMSWLLSKQATALPSRGALRGQCCAWLARSARCRRSRTPFRRFRSSPASAARRKRRWLPCAHLASLLSQSPASPAWLFRKAAGRDHWCWFFSS